MKKALLILSEGEVIGCITVDENLKKNLHKWFVENENDEEELQSVVLDPTVTMTDETLEIGVITFVVESESYICDFETISQY